MTGNATYRRVRARTVKLVHARPGSDEKLVGECGRHTHAYPDAAPYYVYRCAHLGNRFVCWTRSRDSDYNAVDYVEDLPDRGVLVEAPMIFDPKDAPTYWEEFNRRMVDGDPPDPENV